MRELGSVAVLRAELDLPLSEIKSGHSDGVSKKRRIVKSCRSSFTSLARRK
jgi:hypothetical protein